MDINDIEVWGYVKDSAPISDRTGRTMYRGTANVRRLSGVQDEIIIVSDDYIPDGYKRLSGQIRSRHEGENLEVYMYVEHVEENAEALEENKAFVVGHVCARPYYKEVKGRKLKVFMLAVNGKRSYYIPAVCWGKLATSALALGDPVIVTGRLQSRFYIKEERVRKAWELSASGVKVAK